jgi:hypothetical protein
MNRDDELESMLDELKRVDALPERLREKWMAATEAPKVVRVWWRPMLAAAAVVLLLVAVPWVVIQMRKQVEIAGPTTTTRVEERKMGPITVVSVDVADQMTELDRNVMKLEEEVRGLKVAVERMAARKKVEDVLVRHSGW